MSEDLLKDPLPEPWTFGVTQDGRIFFINDEEERTTWLHPITHQPIMTGYLHNKDLPIGWQKGYTVEGAEFYINHKDQTTTLQFPNGKNDKKQEKSKKSRRPSFTGSLFRRSSSKSRDSTAEKKKPSRERPSSAKSQQQESGGTSSSISRKTSFVSSTSGGGKLLVMRRDPNSSIIKQGWLYKQNTNSNGGGMKTWRKRWFLLLSDFCLFYYKDTNEGEVLGSILLPSYTVSTVTTEDKISRKYAFKIHHPGMRTLFVSAESYNDMAEWIQVLTPYCHLQQPATTPPATTTQPATPPPISTPPMSTPPMSSHSKKKTTPPPSATEKEGGFDEFATSSSSQSPRTKQKTTTTNSKDTTTKKTTTSKKNGRSKSVAAASTKKKQQQPTNGSSPRQSRATSKNVATTQQQPPPPRSVSTPGHLDEPPPPIVMTQGYQHQNNNNRGNSQVRGRVTVLPDDYGHHQQSSIAGSTVSSRPLSRQQVMQHQQRMMYNNQSTLPRNIQHATLQQWVQMKQQNVAASEISPNYHHQIHQHHRQASGSRHHHGYQHGYQTTYNNRRVYDNDNQSIMSVPAHHHRINQQQRHHVVRMPQMLHSSSQNISSLGREPHMMLYEQPSVVDGGGVRSSKSHTNLEQFHNIPQTKSDNHDLQHHTQRNTMNNSKSFGNENYQLHHHQDGQIVGGGAFQSTVDHSGRNMEAAKQMDVKSFNGPNKLRGFAAISIKQPTTSPHAAAENSPSTISTMQQNENAADSNHHHGGADKDEIQNRHDRLDEVKRLLSTSRHQLQVLKQDSLQIDDKIEDAKAQSSFTEQYEWQEASLHNQQKMLQVAKNLEALKSEVSEMEKNYRERKSNILALLTNDVDADMTENADKLKDIDSILKRTKQHKVEIVNLLDYYKGGDLLESPRKSDVSANSSSGKTTNNSSTLGMLRSMSCSTHNDIHHHEQDNSSTTSSSYLPQSMKHATSVDNLTAASFAPRSSTSYLSSSSTLSRLNRGRSNGRSARERLSSTASKSQANLSAAQIKKLNHDVQKNQLNTLGRNRNRSSTRLQPTWVQEQRKETDIHRAMKNHNMPKVLKKFKQQQPKQQRNTSSSENSGFDFDSFAQSVEEATGDPIQRRQVEIDEELPPPPNNNELLEIESSISSSLVDLPQYQLIPPDKVNIPNRLIEFDIDEATPLTDEQEKMKRRKIRAIESMLARTGQPVMAPNVHLAASIAAEAGTVARMVAIHATQQQEKHQIQQDPTRHQVEVLQRKPSSSINSTHSSDAQSSEDACFV